MSTIYHVNTGGTAGGSGSQDDPMTWAGIPALTLGTGDHVLFRAGQTHIAGESVLVDYYGTVEYPVVFGSYGGGKAVLDTTGTHDLFKLQDSQYVNFQNLNLNCADPSSAIFFATGSFSEINLYDIDTTSGGYFWREVFGSTPTTATYSFNNCEINRMWSYGIAATSTTGVLRRTTFNRCGYDTSDNSNYAASQGYAILSTNISGIRSTDCKFTDNRGDIVSAAYMGSVLDFNRAHITDFANTGQVALENLMVFNNLSGQVFMRNSILHSESSMLQYMIYNISPNPLQLSVALYNCGLIYSSDHVAGGCLINGGITASINNLFYHTVSHGLPSFNLATLGASNNRYDVDAGAAAGFFPGSSWAAYESSETNSSTGVSGLDPFWYINTNGQLSPTSPILDMGSGNVDFLSDAANMYRHPADDADIGPYTRTYETLKHYTKGGYGRHGFAPS